MICPACHGSPDAVRIVADVRVCPCGLSNVIGPNSPGSQARSTLPAFILGIYGNTAFLEYRPAMDELHLLYSVNTSSLHDSALDHQMFRDSVPGFDGGASLVREDARERLTAYFVRLAMVAHVQGS